MLIGSVMISFSSSPLLEERRKAAPGFLAAGAFCKGVLGVITVLGAAATLFNGTGFGLRSVDCGNDTLGEDSG